MPLWTDDPELLATFRAEVDERLASLSAGLIQLEASPRSREVMQVLLRDTHTLKGSSRMLGLTDLVSMAHAAEELLGSVRDGRITVTQAVIDLLLAACDSIGRGAPGGDLAEGDPAVAQLIADLLAAANPVRELPPVFTPPVRVVGHEPSLVPEPAAVAAAAASPSPATVPTVAPPAAATAPPAAATVPAAASLRVSVAKMRTVLEGVEEVNQGARRLDGTLRKAAEAGGDVRRWSDALAAALPGQLDTAAATALLRLRAAAAAVSAAGEGNGDAYEQQIERLEALRDEAMQLAMVPVRQVLAGYPGLVRRLAGSAGVEVALVLEGDDVELDKRVLDAVTDALGHLVTNAVDHGCEPPGARVEAGKPPVATITVAAHAAGPAVVLTVSDDGAGVDREQLIAAARARGIAIPAGDVLELLFHPGLSTRSVVTSSSGRGVGLDAVRTTVQAIGGDVTVRSVPGEGTTVEVTLPVSLGVIHCLFATLGEETVAVPATAVREAVSLASLPVQHVAGAALVVHREAPLPLVPPAALFGDASEAIGRTGLVVPHAGATLMWAIDEVVADREVVVHDLGSFLTPGGVPGIAGATFADDGRVICVLDVRESSSILLGRPAALAAVPAQREPRQLAPMVLVVEDSVAVRELERAVLAEAGYRVTTCIDGLQAHELLSGTPVDLVLSDVEMPGMTGIELTRAIRETPAWADVPVVLMTSLSGDADRRAGLAAGASAYLLKSGFAPAELIAVIRRLLGR